MFFGLSRGDARIVLEFTTLRLAGVSFYFQRRKASGKF
jgi:hypothetical protein